MLFKQTRMQIRNFIWHLGPENYELLKDGYEFRARYPRQEIRRGLIGAIIPVSALSLTFEFIDPVKSPLLSAGAFLVGFGLATPGIAWSLFNLHEFLKARMELMIFEKEFPRVLEIYESIKKEVS